jgi:protein-tyrosine phosphatase
VILGINYLGKVGDTTGYKMLPLEHAADLADVLRDLSQDSYPALIHCSAGKDRTGMAVATLMTLLGVPKSEVYREFLRSNEDLPRRLERGTARRKAAGQPDPPDACQLAFPGCVKDAWLDDFFQAIETKYGSFEAYTHDGLKLTSVDLDRLRAKFLLEK